MEAMIKCDLMSCQRRSMAGAPGLHSSGCYLPTVGMFQGDFTFEADMEDWLVAVDL